MLKLGKITRIFLTRLLVYQILIYLGTLILISHLKNVYAEHESVVSVFKSRTLHTQTTRSWDFMGLSENVHRNPSYESNVIIGVIDTGIWPESESFSDKNFGPVPDKWKGACIGGRNFTCNKKLIGARYYNSKKSKGPLSINSARDTYGHGTHTASIAAGNHVEGGSFYGLAQGTARGGVPSARIAAYRACNEIGECNEADVLAAFDDAIADGVDIISISIACSNENPVGQYSIEVGAFHAMERGILTVAAAGNLGNSSGTIANSMPWMLSVAASSIDRRFIDKLVLGNGKILLGPAVNSFHLNGSSFPLIRGRDATTSCLGKYAEMCAFSCLDSKLVEGKIVVCRDKGGESEASSAGALGSVVYDDDAPFNYTVGAIPISRLSVEDFSVVEAYLKSTKKPRANILKSEVIGDWEAPVVAPFSSRGPNTKIPEILKPDISAPGVAILAAYSPAGSPSRDILNDKRSVKYSIMSGTSMACPHVAGAAAYVKSLHPKWSASAIQSSLMTTAWRMDASKNPEAEFAYGAGHLDPVKAVNPGLVYETFKEDYVRMLCSIGLNNSKLRIISGDNSSCAAADTFTPKDLNYPTMAVNITKHEPFTVSFPRRVTNVGLSNTTYKAHIFTSSRLTITVKPSTLRFKGLNDKHSFVVVVTGKGFLENTTQSALLVWSDGIHNVHSPIVIHTYSFPTL